MLTEAECTFRGNIFVCNYDFLVKIFVLYLVNALILRALKSKQRLFTLAGWQRNGKATIFALTTGCFIASYSLVDGIGARLAGTSLGFFGWLAIGNGIIVVAFLRLRHPGTFTNIVRHGRKMFFIGGGASFVAYALVTWAFTQAPIALVTALRETSIIFALLIGVFFLKEKLNLTKLLSTFVTLVGAALLRFARSA